MPPEGPGVRRLRPEAVVAARQRRETVGARRRPLHQPLKVGDYEFVEVSSWDVALFRGQPVPFLGSFWLINSVTRVQAGMFAADGGNHS